MKKILNKQISIKTILLIVLVVIFATTATAMIAETVQATLATHITIKLDGEVQTMRNANGDIVYPLSYQGTTYLPVRAVTNMLGLPVEWNAETNTVILGKTEYAGKSVFDVVNNVGWEGWDRYTHIDSLPSRIDDFGNKLPHDYTFAYRGYQHDSSMFWLLDNSYNYLSFTLALERSANVSVVRVRIVDDDTQKIIYEVFIESGQFIEIEDLVITGYPRLSIHAVYVNIGGGHPSLFVLNPTVK